MLSLSRIRSIVKSGLTVRILILSQYYTPEPIFLPSKLAEAMRAQGHEVTVITGFPNYPAGRLYDGYRIRPFSRETINGVKVIRTWLIPYHGMSRLGRVLNYGSYMISAILAAAVAPPCDVIYVWPPPLTVGFSAWIIGVFKRAPFVFDALDLWPDSLIWAGLLKDGTIAKLLSWLERFVYSKAAMVLAVTHGTQEILLSKGVPAAKVLLHPQWVDEGLFGEENGPSRQVRKELGLDGKIIATFAGNLGIVQGLDTIIEAAKILKGRSDIVFLFIGDGNDKARLENLTQQARLTNVVFLGRQPVDSMRHYFAASDILLVHLRDSKLSEIAIPSKTMAYLASGKPIVMAMRGAAADLIREAGAGSCVAPDDAKALSDAILKFADMPARDRAVMGDRGRSFLIEHHDRKKVFDIYEDVFRRVARKAA